MQRRLAAILAADVVGYSRLMGQNEEGTRAAFNSHKEQLIDPLIAEHHGRLFKATGDGFLVEFASVVNAVRCGLAIQEGMNRRMTEEAEERRIVLRVGINIGDVLIEGDDIHGDGVNVAARLESIADAGGIMISADARRQVAGKVDVDFEDLGERTLKNIADPVHIYRVVQKLSDQAGTSQLPVAKDRIPSIAVLPFKNLSSDAEQDYFADGMVEEILTALARFSWLQVMSRNSSFKYKGKSVDVRQVGRDLAVRYVLEGSVRRAGQRIRISGQLIDAETGVHLWADRFEGDLADVFDLQDSITAHVVGAIEPSLRKAEIERSRRMRPENLAAYDLYLRALVPLSKMRPEANSEALEFLERAIELDPTYAPALANAAWAYEQRLLHDWPTAREGDASIATDLARHALGADSGDAATVALASFVLTIVGHDYDTGLSAARRALALNRHSGSVSWMAAWVSLLAGETDAAVEIAEYALKISPADPFAHYLLNAASMAHLLLGNTEKALDCASQSLALDDTVDVSYYPFISACGHSGRINEAKKAIAKLEVLSPALTVSGFKRKMPFQDPNHVEQFLAGLRKAGVSD